MIVLLLAGLSALPREPYEAARMDGASTLQSFIHVTLPLMRPVIIVTLLIRLIFAIKTFDLIFIMTRGGPGTATDLISYFIYRSAFFGLEHRPGLRHLGDPAAGHRAGADGLSLPLHALAGVGDASERHQAQRVSKIYPPDVMAVDDVDLAYPRRRVHDPARARPAAANRRRCA